MKPQVVIFVAPPGAGKGTQADILAEKFGFIHIESSKIIEKKFSNSDPLDEKMNKEKKNWLTGELVDPEMVTNWIIEEIKQYAAQGKSLVFSASPRTEYEAMKQIPIHIELYGKENIKLFHIFIDEEASVERNSNRRICEKNRHPIPNIPEFKNIDSCPHDGSKLVKRELDTPDVIRERFRTYHRRTEPVFKIFRDAGFEPINIDGEQSIEDVSKEILSHFSENQ